MDRVAEAQAEVPVISVEEAQRRREADPNTLILDVRDASQIRETGIIPGAHHTSLGTLLYKADHSLPEEWRDPALNDHDRPIITVCGMGAMASIAAKELKDLGYTRVSILEGGTEGWINSGRSTEPFTGE